MPHPPRFRSPALLAMAVGSFGIGAGELVIMGLLPRAKRARRTVEAVTA